MPSFFLISLEPNAKEHTLFNQRNQKLLDAANTGNPEAQYILGCKYFDRTEELLLAAEGFELIYNQLCNFMILLL
ncbi:hypothetical protein IM40_08325 [Candidatus Paracaedimonas acanthamoebae]|nr:hypothetical protein IM40_08325 [Candidatus Paracaedimonas acanthamoebae]